MWRKKRKNKRKEMDAGGMARPSSAPLPKYDRPKVLLIDLSEDVLRAVREAGFNGCAGTFGAPFKVNASDHYVPVVAKAELPNYPEQEIIFIDLTPAEATDAPEAEKLTSKGQLDWWARCTSTEIDPRPRVMVSVRSDFNRIFNHGGVFVVLAKPRLLQDLVLGRIDGYSLDAEEKIDADNWSFLSVLSKDDFEIERDYGREITVSGQAEGYQNFFQELLDGADFMATIAPTYRTSDQWLPLFSSKFGACVGGMIVREEGKGRVLILPQVRDKPKTVVALLRELLPAISPHLFPHAQGARWVELGEYELQSVLEYKARKVKVRDRAQRELEELDQKIADSRREHRFLHGIITGTGSELVADVRSCLHLVGFENVVAVDETVGTTRGETVKEEDLQILGGSGPLLVEVKGLSGMPREADVLQVDKYVLRRMREWQRTDVRGLSIINHQRNLPCLDRDHQSVFTEKQIRDAENHQIALLTTWDLFRLARGKMTWEWPAESVKALLYVAGRVPVVPTIYRPIGRVAKFYEQVSVVSIEVQECGISMGQRIGFVLPTGYLEQNVDSLQVDNQVVNEVSPGQLVGVKTAFGKDLLRNGTEVFAVVSNSP